MSSSIKSGGTVDADEPGAAYRADTKVTRDLQKHLGLDSCFRTAKSLTCTTDCLWRHHCCRPVAEWLREW